jgi:hypothetical protein
MRGAWGGCVWQGSTRGIRGRGEEGRGGGKRRREEQRRTGGAARDVGERDWGGQRRGSGRGGRVAGEKSTWGAWTQELQTTRHYFRREKATHLKLPKGKSFKFWSDRRSDVVTVFTRETLSRLRRFPRGKKLQVLELQTF